MSNSSGVLVSTRELFTDPEAVALGGFLAGYSGLTREAYALDLRQFAGWLTGHGFRLFEIRRAHIEIIRPRSRNPRQVTSDDLAAPMHDHLLLSLRRTRGDHRPLTGGARAPTQA